MYSTIKNIFGHFSDSCVLFPYSGSLSACFRHVFFGNFLFQGMSCSFICHMNLDNNHDNDASLIPLQLIVLQRKGINITSLAQKYVLSCSSW